MSLPDLGSSRFESYAPIMTPSKGYLDVADPLGQREAERALARARMEAAAPEANDLGVNTLKVKTLAQQSVGGPKVTAASKQPLEKATTQGQAVRTMNAGREIATKSMASQATDKMSKRVTVAEKKLQAAKIGLEQAQNNYNAVVGQKGGMTPKATAAKAQATTQNTQPATVAATVAKTEPEKPQPSHEKFWNGLTTKSAAPESSAETKSAEKIIPKNVKQQNFLLTYRWNIGDITGNKKSDPSENLGKLFNTEFNNGTREQKIEILKMAILWAKDSKYSENDLSNPHIPEGEKKTIGDKVTAQFQELATKATGADLQGLGFELEAAISKAQERSAAPIETNATQGPTDIMTAAALIKDLDRMARGKMKDKEYNAFVSDFANSLTANLINHFSKIKSSELTGGDWGPNMSTVAKHSTQLAYFVSEQIVSRANPEERTKMIEFFIAVEANLSNVETATKESPVNLHSVAAINTGLTSTPVRRLDQVKNAGLEGKKSEMNKAISQEAKTKMDQHEELFSGNNNFKAQRDKDKALQMGGIPHIPFTGRYQTDLTFAKDNPSIIADGSVSESKNNVLGNATRAILSPQDNITPSAPKFNLNIVFQDRNEDKIYEQSYAVQPKVAQPPPK